MDENRFDVLALDKLKKLQACRVYEAVPWLGLVNYIEDVCKGLILYELRVVEVVLETQTCPEKFQGR